MKQAGPLEVGVSVRDLATLRQFYVDGLSFTCEVEVELPASVATLTGLSKEAVSAAWLRSPGGERVKLFQTAAQPIPRIVGGELLGVEGLAYLTFYVEDIEATVAACLQAGGKPVGGTEPVDVGEMKIAFLRDPEGNVVELVERTARRGG